MKTLMGQQPFNKYLWRILILTVAANIVACSAKDDDDVKTEQPIKYETGVFIDSPVANIDYQTENTNGKTNSSGEFQYLPGDKITFYIDNISLPQVPASSVITPVDIAKAASDDLDTQSSIAVNIARLLQTLDNDGNPDNGIEIEQDLVADSAIDFSLQQVAFETAFISVLPEKNLVSAETAITHIEKVLTDSGMDTSVITNFPLIDNNGETGSGETGGGETGGGETGGGETGGAVSLTSLPKVITNTNGFSQQVELNGSLQKLVTLELDIAQNYASLSLFSDDSLLIDNIDIPAAGSHTLQVLVELSKTGPQEFKFVGRTSDITINAVTVTDISQQMASFTDISEQIGLQTEDTFKYGGPSVGDVNNDGHYDFVTANHNYIPPQLVTNNGDNTVTIKRLFPGAQDFHGNALGDYDNDGDLDIMVALGGANGTSPTSYALLQNNNGAFENVAVEVGINTPARGRAPRWVDFDLDGDLDVMLANAKTPNNDGPIQLFYRNMGDGTFTQARVPGVESQNSERVLITDVNGDQIDDLVMYSPLSIWQGNGNFTFTNVTNTLLPEELRNVWGINAITDVDVDNDGNLDLYLAFGKTHYQLSRKSIDFNPTNGELNIHDDGEKGTTLIDFTAQGAVTLSDLGLTYRQWNGDYPIFLGQDKTRHVVKAEGFQPNQLPAEMLNADETLTINQDDATGWAEERSVNGLYIGHTGDGNWKAEWVRDQDIYWNVSFTLTNLSDVSYDWTPNNRNGQDYLLLNQGGKFVDASADWNIPKGGDHWGVTHGDFNNDGWNDLFVYRYGFLQERISDLLLLNTGDNSFVTTHMHGAFDITDNGHGDMGQAFDFDKDGAVDMLSGSEEGGHWYLWQNKSINDNNYLLVDVGYSPLKNVDSMSAEIIVTLDSDITYKKRVGSAGEVFSAGVIDTVHFGLGKASNVSSVQVKWRNGETVFINNVTANSIISTDDAANPIPVAINLGSTEIKLRQGTDIFLEPVFTPLNAKPELVWTSSDAAIATVDAQGIVSGLAVGDVTITATSNLDTTVFAAVTVKVGEFEVIKVSDVKISGDEQAFYVAQQTQLTVATAPSDADNSAVTWSSSNETVATIDAAGLVSNLSVGSTKITATADDSKDATLVSDSVDITVETFLAQSIEFDDDSKYTTELPVDILLDVTVNYHAGSGQTVSDAGITFYVRELNSAWVPVNDLILTDLTSVGTESGTATNSFDLIDLKLTSELDAGNFYFLFVKFSNDKGESVNKGISPLNIVAASGTNTGGSGGSSSSGNGNSSTAGDVCTDSDNLLSCGNFNGEEADTSEWYSHARDNYTTDLSNEISVSTEQANGGNSSIKFAFNDAGTEQHIILKGVKFEVSSAGDYQFSADVLGANLSTGSDYIIEISIRLESTPEAAETYKLWHKKSADVWHTLSTTQTLPVGEYIVGFKVFSPGFANTLTLDYYFDNLTIKKL